MCLIAGYSGTKNAAPILIDMLKKIEYYDGGRATGIATIHEGKLYVEKAGGDVEMLLRTTDALNLPGTTGFIHSRPYFDYMSTTQPFFDNSGELALIENGTREGTGNDEFFAEIRKCMDDFLDRGIKGDTSYDISPKEWPLYYTKDGKGFYYVEPFAMFVGDMVKDVSSDKLRDALALAVKKNHERFPTDNITLSIHSKLPDTITIGTVSRPMSVLEADGETYLASCAIAFPEDVNGKVTHLPMCSVSQVTPKGLEFYSKEFETVRVEQVSDKILQHLCVEMEKNLTGKKDKPLMLMDIQRFIPKDMWSEPLVDCKYVKQKGMLKPLTATVYQAFWNLHKEGRLRSELGTVLSRERQGLWPTKDCYFTRFWLE